ncbi:MAG: N-acetylmuramoyl-L-alanine amidase [Clostridiales bacterium]|nr:N-acetylmuramoyl-L-alanine amidase [Clostridiales bacterium]
MPQDYNDVELKFKKILKGLPEDKRKELFERLKSMEPAQREEMIRKIVSANENRHEVQRPNKPVKNQNVNQKKKSSAPQPKPTAKKAPEITEKDFSRKTSETKTKSGKELIIVISILVVFCAACLGIKVLFDDKMDAFVEKAQETAVSDVSETTNEIVSTSEITTTTTVASEETTPTPSPTPTMIPLAADSPDLTGLTIVIDPGHQEQRSERTEKVADWLSDEKCGATSGAVGVTSGVPEYELTLKISLKLKNYLEQCGATVILTRETNDVDLTNQERAQIAVDNSADIFIRIHTDAANDSKSSGVKVFVPDSGNYKSSAVGKGDILGQTVADSLGLEFLGTKATSMYTGLNYANSVASFQISLGLLSNSNDEAVLLDENNQVKICEAISQFAGEFKES